MGKSQIIKFSSWRLISFLITLFVMACFNGNDTSITRQFIDGLAETDKECLDAYSVLVHLAGFNPDRHFD